MEDLVEHVSKLFGLLGDELGEALRLLPFLSDLLDGFLFFRIFLLLVFIVFSFLSLLLVSDLIRLGF